MADIKNAKAISLPEIVFTEVDIRDASDADWSEDPFHFFSEWNSQADDEAFTGLT